MIIKKKIIKKKSKKYKKVKEVSSIKKSTHEKTEKENKLILIPKIEKYIEYMLNVILKLPRTEKFSIGTEYKLSMYKLLELVMILNKIEKEEVKESIKILNKLDSLLNTQRIYLRIMKKNRWIDEKKLKIAMEEIYEIGKILGGFIKYYAKNNKKSI